MLRFVEMTEVGPSHEMRLDFAHRLNLLTGDNGLGKTFILDVAWWALTRTWAGRPAWPRTNGTSQPAIHFQIEGKTGSQDPQESLFDRKTGEWSRSRGRPPMTGLVLYVKADGGFALWDPARNYYKNFSSRSYSDSARPAAFIFDLEDVWDGLVEEDDTDKRILCNGLIRDWVTWQDRKSYEFGILKDILKQLSPHESELLEPGNPTRLGLTDVRDIPTLKLPYGEVPLPLASAGMRRIVALAYLITWAHTEHRRASETIGEAPTDRFTILIDEAEAHLHPQWQRTILPALLSVIEKLGTEGAIQHGKIYPHVQMIVATHAPLILASVEPRFSDDIDSLFVFDLDDGRVMVREERWAKQGDTDAWLTSDVFGLKQARSTEAEKAILAANAFMRGDFACLPNELREKDQIHNALLKALPEDDPFWPRWIVKTGLLDAEPTENDNSGGDCR